MKQSTPLEAERAMDAGPEAIPAGPATAEGQKVELPALVVAGCRGEASPNADSRQQPGRKFQRQQKRGGQKRRNPARILFSRGVPGCKLPNLRKNREGWGTWQKTIKSQPLGTTSPLIL